MRKRCVFCCNLIALLDTVQCDTCHAVLYCSEKCRESDIKDHRLWCVSMCEWMKQTEFLAQLPFTYAKEISKTTVTSFDIDQWLTSLGLIRDGYWTSVFSPMSGERKRKYGATELSDTDYILPSESIMLDEVPSDVMQRPLTSWKDYYSWRGFRLDSPISALLHWPLTLYYIITHLMARDYPDHIGSDICEIHILGAECEASMPKLFTELGHMLPGTAFKIRFYGPKISKSADNKSITLGNVCMSMHRGLYHECHTASKPRVALGYNAGLAAYPTWKETLVYLAENNIPAYFTDFCLWSMACSDRCITQAGIGQLSTPEINPFRSPISVPNDSHVLPCYSNGFISSLKPCRSAKVNCSKS